MFADRKSEKRSVLEFSRPNFRRKTISSISVDLQQRRFRSEARTRSNQWNSSTRNPDRRTSTRKSKFEKRNRETEIFDDRKSKSFEQQTSSSCNEKRRAASAASAGRSNCSARQKQRKTNVETDFSSVRRETKRKLIVVSVFELFCLEFTREERPTKKITSSFILFKFWTFEIWRREIEPTVVNQRVSVEKARRRESRSRWKTRLMWTEHLADVYHSVEPCLRPFLFRNSKPIDWTRIPIWNIWFCSRTRRKSRAERPWGWDRCLCKNVSLNFDRSSVN